MRRFISGSPTKNIQKPETSIINGYILRAYSVQREGHTRMFLLLSIQPAGTRVLLIVALICSDRARHLRLMEV